MSSTYHVQAIVLRRQAWRDAARLYTFYTREHGKIAAVGRGTRKISSKLAAHLEPFTRAELLLARGRRHETICGAVTIRTSEVLASDDRRYAAASFVAEAADHFIKPFERDERLWDLLDAALAEIAERPAERLGSSLAAFAWRFMDQLGYRPRLDACAACARSLAFEPALFLPIRGAALCRSCRPEERELAGAVPLDPAACREIAEIAESEAEPGPIASSAALAFLEAHLDRPLVTLPIVRAQLFPRAMMTEPSPVF